MDIKRGRLISAPDRQVIIELVNDAIESGATKEKPSKTAGVDPRTFDRWLNKPNDMRPFSNRPIPKNKLTY